MPRGSTPSRPFELSSGFYAGRALKQTCRWLSGFLSGDKPSESVIRQMSKHAVEVLRNTPPRVIACDSSEEAPMILVWTDGREPTTSFAGAYFDAHTKVDLGPRQT